MGNGVNSEFMGRLLLALVDVFGERPIPTEFLTEILPHARAIELQYRQYSTEEEG